MGGESEGGRGHTEEPPPPPPVRFGAPGLFCEKEAAFGLGAVFADMSAIHSDPVASATSYETDITR